MGMTQSWSHRFCVAPMMAWSDRHCRYFWRLLSRKALLHTEMVSTGALLHGDRARWLDFHSAEHPLALQLGGSDPGQLATCTRWARQWGYDAVNLNCGCPSSRVQAARFGACLMAEPQLVRDCVTAMREAADIPVTVKHRLGIDQRASYPQLLDFVATVAQSGATTFIVHARQAWLQGLSPRENRDLPPLRRDWVYRLKRDLPHLEIVINGGIGTLAECEQHLAHVDGVMLGRAAYRNPYLLAQVDRQFFQAKAEIPSRHHILAQMQCYAQGQLAAGVRLHHITRHLTGLWYQEPGAAEFRRQLGAFASRPEAGSQLLERVRQQLGETTRKRQPRRAA